MTVLGRVVAGVVCEYIESIAGVRIVDATLGRVKREHNLNEITVISTSNTPSDCNNIRIALSVECTKFMVS